MNRQDIIERVRAALAKLLKVDLQIIDDNASQLQFATWDSVRHMNVILALENEFDIEFVDTELPKLVSVPLMVAAIERHTST